MVISKKRNFFGQILFSCHPGNQLIYQINYFFFLEYLEFSKDCSQLFSIIRILNLSKILCFFPGFVVTLGFILLFIENGPSHIEIGVRQKLLQKCI